jgi:hypothetical protein
MASKAENRMEESFGHEMESWENLPNDVKKSIIQGVIRRTSDTINRQMGAEIKEIAQEQAEPSDISESLTEDQLAEIGANITEEQLGEVMSSHNDTQREVVHEINKRIVEPLLFGFGVLSLLAAISAILMDFTIVGLIFLAFPMLVAFALWRGS